MGAVLAVYSNVYGNTFLFDDEFLIQKNKFLTSLEFLPNIFSTSSTAGFGGTDSFFRPLQIFLYLLVVQLFGLSTAAFHGLNIFLHIINAGLVFMLAQRFGVPRVPAFFAALIWAVHPLHTEAVTYMSATADPLYTGFVLIGVLLWGRAGKANIVPMACFILGLLSKETAIVFPALVCVLLFFENAERCRLKTYFQTWPCWAVAFGYLIARATFLDFDDSYAFYQEENPYTQHIHLRVFTFLSTLVDYARLLFVPTDLHMDRIMKVPASFFMPKVLAGAGILFAWATLCLFFFRQKKEKVFLPLVLAGAWFLAAYFPHSGIVVPVNALILEHWMYLPSMGLVIGGALLLVHLPQYGQGVSRELLCTLALLAAGAFSVMTWEQNKIWQSPLTFYPHILKFETGSARVFNNLAMAYEDVGRVVEAEETYRKAIAAWDVYPQTHYNLGNLMLRKGETEGAVWHYQRALELNKRFDRAAHMLEQIYRAQGEVVRADEYKKILDDLGFRPINLKEK